MREYSPQYILPSYKDYGPNVVNSNGDRFYLYVSDLCSRNKNSYIDSYYQGMNDGVNNFKIIDYEVFSIMII